MNAKSRSKDEEGAISESSLELLKGVKKGKARKFVMLCKGTSVVSLVVFKKGSFDRYKKEAKESGSGQLYYGVVDGQGENITFKLARSEGFDKAPVKPPALKSFLQDEGDFHCKPLIEIVDATPLALDPDDNPLVARFQALRPRIDDMLQQSADQAGTIDSLCREIGQLLDDDQDEPAAAKLTELERLLGQAGGGAAATPSDPQATAWRQRLADIEPRYGQSLRENSPQAASFRAVMAFAVEKAGAGSFTKALAALDRLAALLASPPTVGPVAAPTAPSSSDAPSVSTTAEEGETPLKPFSIVKVQAARLAWDKTRKQVQVELAALDDKIRSTIAAHNADPAAATEYVKGEVDAGVGELYQILDVLDNRLIDTLDLALNAEGKQRESLHRQAVGLIDEYQSFVAESPLLKRIDKNPFLGCSVKQRVDAALAALAKTL